MIQTNLHPQYVTNINGEKTQVLLPIQEYLDLLEDLEDLSIIAERRDEESFPHKQVLSELKANGLL